MTRNPRPMLARRALDLFAGAGGWDLAAHDLGIDSHGVELMPEARATRDAAGLTTVHDDVWTVPAALLAGYGGLIASPPCQTFSTAGSGSGRKALDDVLRVVPHVANVSRSRLRKIGAAFGDDRTALVLSPLWYALNMPAARWLAWEQVPTVLPVWEACAEVLRAQGWHVWTGVLNAEQYGVPQTRRRAVLIASRDHEVGMPTPTHSRYYPRDPQRLDAGVPSWVSMAQAVSSAAGYVAMGDVRNSKGCVRPVACPAPTMTGSMDNGNFRWIVAAGATGAGKPRPDTDPAPTITGKGTAYWLPSLEAYRPAGGRMTADTVRVTVAEAGALQTFPVDYPWQGTQSRQYLQAGNAVPPGLAAAVLREAWAAAAQGEPREVVVVESTGWALVDEPLPFSA